MPKTHPTYDEEFRRNAVELLLQSNRPLKRVAHELGVAANSLRNWRDRFLGKGGATKVAQTQSEDRSGAPLALADPAAEIRRLRRENEYLRRQREILKKAVSILSEDPQSGMR
jgi:transposase